MNDRIASNCGRRFCGFRFEFSVQTQPMICIERRQFQVSVSAVRTSLIKLLPCFLLLVFSQSQTAPPQKDAYQKEAMISEDQGTAHIVANSVRPLAQALDALQRKYGWLVDYEDRRYLSKVDTKELVDELHAPKPRLVPAGGRFEASFPVAKGDV